MSGSDTALGLFDAYRITSFELLGLGFACLVSYGGYLILRTLVVRPYLSPLKTLPGPPGYDSIIWGHLGRIFAAPGAVIHEEWVEKYGPTMRYRGFFLSYRLFTMDSRAISHILSHSADYPKPDQMRDNLIRLFGKGVLLAEGEDHRRQRRIMNPCFGITQIRNLVPTFHEKSNLLRDLWSEQIGDGSTDGVVDVQQWLTRATLDVIGSAGFDYEFDSLTLGETNELAAAFQKIFSSQNGFSFLALLQSRFGIFRLIRDKRSRDMQAATAIMRRVGTGLIENKKRAVQKSLSSGEIEKKDIVGHDLLSVLIRANLATDAKESHRMSDEEVLAQISTMLIAGHETTSSSVTWLLYELSQHPEVQQKLREELLQVKTEQPSMEELNALPYLELVIRENSRVNAVVNASIRVAGTDDIIPLDVPYLDSKGVEQTEIKISKGDPIFISILALNRYKKIWGEDAHEFRPERWERGAPTDLPGIYAGTLTFLGGPRACIGYRFALMEMKALIFSLVRSFVFELSDPSLIIERKSNLVTRPVVTYANGEKKSEMPLRIRPYTRN